MDKEKIKQFALLCLCVFTISFCIGVIPGNISLKQKLEKEQAFSKWLIEYKLNGNEQYWRKIYEKDYYKINP